MLKAEPGLGFESWRVDGEGEGRGGEGKGWLVVEGGARLQIINNQIIFILLFCTLLTFIVKHGYLILRNA